MEIAGAQRWDNLWLGVRTGVLLPVTLLLVALLVIYCRLDEGESLARYVLGVGIPSRLLSLATLANLVTFLIAIRTNRLFTARGILGATIVLAILSVALRLLF